MSRVVTGWKLQDVHLTSLMYWPTGGQNFTLQDELSVKPIMQAAEVQGNHQITRLTVLTLITFKL